MTDFPLSEILRKCPNDDPDCLCWEHEFVRKVRYERAREAEIHRATLAKQEEIYARREFQDE